MSEEKIIENGKRVEILAGPRAGKRGPIVMSFSDPEIVRWWNDSFANERVTGHGYVIEIGCQRVCEPIHHVRQVPDEESSPQERKKILEKGIQKSVEDTAFVQSSQTQKVNAKGPATPTDPPPTDENKVVFRGL